MRSVRLVWRHYAWLIIGVAWAIALALGFIGFALIASNSGKSYSFLDVAYRTLQLIPLESGNVDGAAWPLNLARFLIPFLAAWTVVHALLSLFHERWQQVLLRLWRDHVIICGLSRKGWLLAQGFALRGDRVVVIEADESHDLIVPCRERGIVVLVGDATDPDLLQRAGARWAHHLVAVTDDDGINAEIAVRTRSLFRTAAQVDRLSAGQRSPLICTVHLVDPLLSELARTGEMALGDGLPFHLELFNVFDRGARLLWSQFAPIERGGDSTLPDRGRQISDCSSHVLVIGFGRLGEGLVVCAARDWYSRLNESPCRMVGRLRITVIDLEADWKCQALGLRYPQMASVCDLIPLTMNVLWPGFYEAAFLNGSTDFPPVSAVFVCFDNDSLGLRTGLAIHHRLLQISARPIPVVVRMAEAGGLARLVDPEDNKATVFASLHPFGLLNLTCTPEAIEVNT